jgi:hypothetical protein
MVAPTAGRMDEGGANDAPFRRHAPRSDGHALNHRGHVVLGSIDPRCERRAQGASAVRHLTEDSRTKRRYFAVLQMGPIQSPLDAVRAAVVAEHRAAPKD